MSVATILDRFRTPPCATHLGFEILEADGDSGTVKVAFLARPEFCNPDGNGNPVARANDSVRITPIGKITQ